MDKERKLMVVSVVLGLIVVAMAIALVSVKAKIDKYELVMDYACRTVSVPAECKKSLDIIMETDTKTLKYLVDRFAY